MVWVNREPAGPLQRRSPEMLPPLELLGDGRGRGGAGALVQAAAEGEAHLLSLRQLNLRVGNARPRAGTPFRSKAM